MENLTAVWFLLAGLLLFAAALMERSFFRRCVYNSRRYGDDVRRRRRNQLGQRIFGFATPDFLIRLNNQKEFTVHNIANGTFNIIYLNGTLVLCMTTSAAFFCQKDKVFGIPLPSIPLMLGFLIVISYASGANFMASGANFMEHFANNFREYLRLIRISVESIVIEEKGLLILFIIFTLFSGHVKLVIVSSATLALVLALAYVNYRSDVLIGSLFEVREYLFGICCLFYCLEILLDRGRFAAIPRAPFRGPGPPGGRIPF